MSFRPGQAKGANVRSAGGSSTLPAWVNHTAFVHLESEYRAALLDPEIWYIVVGAELFLTSASNTYDVLTNESLGRKYVDGVALRSNGSIQWNSSDNSLLNFYHLAPINLNAPSGGPVTCLLGTPTSYALGEVRFGHLGLVDNANITTGTYTWNPNSNAQVVSYDSAAAGVNIEPDLLSGDAKLKRESYVSTDYFANVQKKITLANNTFYYGGLAVEIYQDGAGNFEGEWTGLINITGKKPGAVTEIVSVTAIAMLKTDSTGTEASIEVLSDNSNGMITGIGFINNAVGFTIQEFNLVVQGVSGFEPTISGRTIGSTQNSKFIASSISTNAPFYSIALPTSPSSSKWETATIDGVSSLVPITDHVQTKIGGVDGDLVNDYGKHSVVADEASTDAVEVSGAGIALANGIYSYVALDGFGKPYYQNPNGYYLSIESTGNLWYCIDLALNPIYYAAAYTNYEVLQQPFGTYWDNPFTGTDSPIAVSSSGALGYAYRGKGTSKFDRVILGSGIFPNFAGVGTRNLGVDAQGEIVLVSTGSPGAWVNASLAANIGVRAGWRPLRYRSDGAGSTEIEGSAKYNTGFSLAGGNNVVLFNLPVGFRPNQSLSQKATVSYNGSYQELDAWVQVDSTGNVTLYNSSVSAISELYNICLNFRFSLV